jgi:hypothetical protein
VIFSDANKGKHFYLVKIGKCESKVDNGQDISAAAAVCYRFEEHKKHLGTAFDRGLDSSTTKDAARSGQSIRSKKE